MQQFEDAFEDVIVDNIFVDIKITNGE